MVLSCKSSAILKNSSANSDIRGHAFWLIMHVQQQQLAQMLATLLLPQQSLIEHSELTILNQAMTNITKVVIITIWKWRNIQTFGLDGCCTPPNRMCHWVVIRKCTRICVEENSGSCFDAMKVVALHTCGIVNWMVFCAPLYTAAPWK